MAERFVLDSSALLALLFVEPGWETAAASLGRCALSSLNYSEVIGKLVQRGEELPEAIRIADELELSVIAWDADLAREAADLSALAWTHGLSLGDRACLATARHLRRPVLTAERNWRRLPDLGIEIRVIR
jgi:PIN domain nuclease of toxin-antitoxin system